ncbi:hypothetical protein [Sinorhizobium fredii]|uniref:Lipoprotein n=2 Tax=Rhizobium fredii TaxID=380 RepID=G9A7S6_SINF1|nr:hypothetical protein [Sinorhizobium fredii]CCE96306.1 hypothetical protein SFHH103_01809 [Sinorhizobium fredii HH103]
MKRRIALMRSALTMMPVLFLAGCGTSAPANVSGLRAVVRTDLAGARGATAADQRRIDRTVVGLCAASVWTKGECAKHGERRDG